MSDAVGVRLAAAAESLVGTPFRLHGRDPAIGLDCVGVVGEALRRIGRKAVLPRGYSLRMGDVRSLLHFATASRLVPVDGAMAAGDVVLVHLHHVQPHLLVALDESAFVHAHAGLGRVVRQTAPFPMPRIGSWRLEEKG